MKLTIPELALVVLIGPSGSGKSSFARKPLVQLARDFHCLPVAIVFNLPEQVCHDRNRGRSDRDFGPHVIRQQMQQMRRSLRGLEREGFRHVFVLSTPEEVDAVVIERQPLWNNLKHEHGPFDIIGDVHGCYDELVALLGQIGYQVVPAPEPPDRVTVRVPEGRRAIFVGDLVDRGPKIPDVLRLVMGMVEAGTALCVPGNHDVKLMRKLRGKDVQITHGLADSLAQLESQTEDFRCRVADFIDDLVSHYTLDDGRLVVAHAGMKESMQGRGSGKVRDFALYGETTGETDEFGLPVRYNWAAEYRGKATVVYGHSRNSPMFLLALHPVNLSSLRRDLPGLSLLGPRLVKTRGQGGRILLGSAARAASVDTGTGRLGRCALRRSGSLLSTNQPTELVKSTHSGSTSQFTRCCLHVTTQVGSEVGRG